MDVASSHELSNVQSGTTSRDLHVHPHRRSSAAPVHRGGQSFLYDRKRPAWSHDAVGDVLEGVVEFGSDGAHRAVHQLLHPPLQLLLRQRHVEALLQATDGTAALEAGQLGACGAEKERP